MGSTDQGLANESKCGERRTKGMKKLTKGIPRDEC